STSESIKTSVGSLRCRSFLSLVPPILGSAPLVLNHRVAITVARRKLQRQQSFALPRFVVVQQQVSQRRVDVLFVVRTRALHLLTSSHSNECHAQRAVHSDSNVAVHMHDMPDKALAALEVLPAATPSAGTHSGDREDAWHRRSRISQLPQVARVSLYVRADVLFEDGGCDAVVLKFAEPAACGVEAAKEVVADKNGYGVRIGEVEGCAQRRDAGFNGEEACARNVGCGGHYVRGV
ncbi:hypothetical protein BD626DRAFT_618496, partial [Schizophyllum amplum]